VPPDRLGPLSDAEIGQIADELRPRLTGALAGKAYLRDPETLVIELGRDRLLISVQARASRLHLETGRPVAQGSPPAFAMLIRRRAGGHRLASLTVEPGERIVTLAFGPITGERLVAELTGPHANLFWLGEDGEIVTVLKRSHSTTRVLSAGQPYTLPTAAPMTARWRGQRRFGDSPGVAERAAAWYAETLVAEEARLRRERAAIHLRREIERLARRERALEGDLARVTEAAGLRKLADLILANLHRLPGRGATSYVVPDDFEDGAPLTIPALPELDARANAARFYRQHKRLSAGRKRVDERLAATRAERDALLVRLAAIDSAPDVPDAASAFGAEPRSTRRRAVVPERLPYREYRSAAGEAIWVGRGAADNDTLTFRHARGGDLWLHCLDAAGAHVVVPLRSGRPAAEATLLDAATLAASFSRLSGEAQVDVLYTHVKNLRKPKGAPPGRVFTSDTKTLRIRLEPERLARLLAPVPDEPV
jgi:predicted ribosome quality control (RQC) complex YloA/Tae2 family protein